MGNVIYVANISRAAAFRFAHPRRQLQPVTLHLFDYSTGVTYVYENWQGGNPGKPLSQRPIRDGNTLHEVYEMIRAIGRDEPGTLSQLHCFTHGTPEQGVTLGPYGEERQPQFDHAMKKGTEKADDFIKAFAADALIKLWGCGFQPPAKKLTLDYWRTKNKARRLKIQQSIEGRIRGMYALRFSEFVGVTIWAAPPGWKAAMDLPLGAPYVDFWDPDTGPMPGTRWWRVSPDFVKGAGAEFYRRILHAEIDPVGYVGVNESMSLAPEPDSVLEAQTEADVLAAEAEATALEGLAEYPGLPA